MAALLSHGRQMRQTNLDSQGWLWLLLGVGCCLLSLVVSGLAWVVILRWLGVVSCVSAGDFRYALNSSIGSE